MSSNLTPEARKAYQDYLDANDIDDRIKKLELFISKIPKHKATERIVALNKSRLAKLRREKEQETDRKKKVLGVAEDPFAIKRDAHCLQILMVSDFFESGQGVGKTTLLKALTGLKEAHPGVFTATPLIGIIEASNIKYQLVEEPALRECSDLNRIIAGIRTTDIATLVIDLSKDPLTQMAHILEKLEENSIYINQLPPNIKIEKTGSGKIQTFFLGPQPKDLEETKSFIHDMAAAHGIMHAVVKVYEDVSVDQLERAFNPSSHYIPAIILATKADMPNTKESYNALLQNYGKSSAHHLEILPLAVTYDEHGNTVLKGFDSFSNVVLTQLNLIRIYTKSKKGVASKPLVVQKESTIGDVALKVHKDLYNAFDFAYVFRNLYEHQDKTRIRAGLEFKVEENDIIEIFARI